MMMTTSSMGAFEAPVLDDIVRRLVGREEPEEAAAGPAVGVGDPAPLRRGEAGPPLPAQPPPPPRSNQDMR
ncbi:serine/threonine-protein phosphatase PP1-like isoform X2 [Iris pallida]|uniref:Serine/threonine-protein phosphatase PP1-like isoform X2 n=1 Tax=Iris pallida TaxID=29817 RepID=A0AAX6E466_IRIPA|nr:serine/threonine-protein phosphatase PP1-like isoform X2 [Iris pallida]